jgi:hypothetical protein
MQLTYKLPTHLGEISGPFSAEASRLRAQLVPAERRQHLGEEFIQILLFFCQEIRQRVVVHFR